MTGSKYGGNEPNLDGVMLHVSCAVSECAGVLALGDVIPALCAASSIEVNVESRCVRRKQPIKREGYSCSEAAMEASLAHMSSHFYSSVVLPADCRYNVFQVLSSLFPSVTNIRLVWTGTVRLAGMIDKASQLDLPCVLYLLNVE